MFTDRSLNIQFRVHLNFKPPVAIVSIEAATGKSSVVVPNSKEQTIIIKFVLAKLLINQIDQKLGWTHEITRDYITGFVRLELVMMAYKFVAAKFINSDQFELVVLVHEVIKPSITDFGRLNHIVNAN